MSRSIKENSVQKACLDWLNTIPGVSVWRQNTGAQKLSYTSKRTGKTKTRFIRFGQRGQGDITGIGPYGVRIEVEIKKPGEEPSTDQEAWMHFVDKRGGISFWCDSLDSCISRLRWEFGNRNWVWNKHWEVL